MLRNAANKRELRKDSHVGKVHVCAPKVWFKICHNKLEEICKQMMCLYICNINHLSAQLANMFIISAVSQKITRLKGSICPFEGA